MVTYTVNINGVPFDDWWSVKVVRTNGQLYEAELFIPSIRDVDDGDNIKVDNLIKIYRDNREIFKGVIRIVDFNDNEDATVRANDMAVKLYDEMVMERRDYINKYPYEVYLGYRDNAITAQPNPATTHIEVISNSSLDSTRIRIFGRDDDSSWRDEQIVMTGTDACSTSTNFKYLAYASLVNSAQGTVTVRDSLANTLGTFAYGDYTIAATDDFGHIGNGLLFFPENTSLHTFYGFVTNIDSSVNVITTRNEFDNRLIAAARIANQTDHEWYVDEDSSSDMIYDSI